MGAFLTLLLAVCAVQNQEPPPKPDPAKQEPKPEAPKQEPKQEPAPKPEPPPPPPGREAVLHAGVNVRALFPMSSFDRDFDVFGAGSFTDFFGTVDWSDFYPSGVGGSLELDVLWEPRGTAEVPAPKDAWVIGPTLSIGYDRFEGHKRTDRQGLSIDPDALQVFTFLVGPKLVKNFEGGVFLDGRLAMGAAYYPSVDANFHMPPGFPATDFKGEFLSSTLTFGMEVAIHGGFRVDNVSIVLGGDFRILAGPVRGENVHVSPGPLLAIGADIGIELGF